MSIFNEFRGFWGTGAELTERAKVMSRKMGLKTEKLTERLIRYYAAEGVLDKPDRLGREAAYHFRHLLQLLIARRLVDEGVSLVAISKFNLKKSTEELELALSKPSKEEAQAVTEMYLEETVTAKEHPSIVGQPIAMSDIYLQIKELNQKINEEAQELKKTRYQLETLIKDILDTQHDFYKRMESEQAVMKHMLMSSLDQMAQMTISQNTEFGYQIDTIKKQASLAQDEILVLMRNQKENRLFK